MEFRNLVHELKKALIVHLENKEGLGVFTLEEITEECKSENMLNVNVCGDPVVVCMCNIMYACIHVHTCMHAYIYVHVGAIK